MRSLHPALVRTACGLTLALALLSGCSKKVTAPNTRTLPEGRQDGQLLMMGWSEQPSVSFTVADPGTPENPGDDVLASLANDFWIGPGVVRSATLDASQSNQLEVFRVAADGNVEELFDFMLPPSLRYIGSGTDLYEFSDPAPPSTPTYVGRGTLDGVVTTASPVSNRMRVSGSIDETMDFLVVPKLFAGDSVFKIQYTEDPRATFYLVEVSDGNGVLGNGASFSLERRTRAIPSPLQPGTRSLSSFFSVIPPGVGAAGIQIVISSRVWPLAFYIRVSAYDADGRMVNRVNDYMRTRNRDGDLNLTTYEPLGGAIEMIDPYPNPVAPTPVPDVLTRAQVFAILGGFGAPEPAGTSLAAVASAPAPAAASSMDRVRALSLVGRSARFTPEAVRRAIASARATTDRPAAGTAPGAARPSAGTASR